MSPGLLIFADGTTFFIGLGLVLVAEMLLLCFRNRILVSVFTVFAVIGAILVIVSSTPLPVWAYVLWILPALAGLISLNFVTPSRNHSRACVMILLLMTLLLCFMEAPYHCLPHSVVSKETTVYVLGDSISAGIGTKERCWPEVLGEMTPYQVVNLARAGAKVEHVFPQQTKDIAGPGSFIILEIGGNDLLGGTDASKFREELDSLVAALREKQHTILLLELPLFPFQNAYGKAQRDMAAKYDVALLPKKYFARVLGTEKGTLDGLHLSQSGHNEMAAIISRVLTPQE